MNKFIALTYAIIHFTTINVLAQPIEEPIKDVNDCIDICDERNPFTCFPIIEGYKELESFLTSFVELDRIDFDVERCNKTVFTRENGFVTSTEGECRIDTRPGDGGPGSAMDFFLPNLVNGKIVKAGNSKLVTFDNRDSSPQIILTWQNDDKILIKEILYTNEQFYFLTLHKGENACLR